MRTTLVDDNGNPLYVNRLIDEDSPYLRQHAHNPVDWYPWGAEAFARARTENKPVFLSIGYSTCHWCHVMEHESFDNVEIADFLNQHFVSIKLDRELRPDLDEIYMTGVQIMTGHGGWPMSNFLTGDGRPFFAGTYYPPGNFLQLLQQLVALWQSRKDDVYSQAAEITTAIDRYTSAKSNRAESGDRLKAASVELLSRVDQVYGGFGTAPKFPNESQLLLLLEDWQRNRNDQVEKVLKLTLDRLCRGGIYDQVAGGFHRYSVDRQWLVPHFEKMLYNQAQLLTVYTKAWSSFDDPACRQVAIETGEYVLRDMCSSDGGFYSATDADSEGEEGLFFVWTLPELSQVLTDADLLLVRKLYGVTESGNFEGRNILNLQQSIEDYALTRDTEPESVYARLRKIKTRLYEVREQRIHPLRDEKIITGWNGMMISALALAGFRLGRPDFLEAAVNAADAIWERHWHPDQGLWRISLNGHVSIPGNLEDHACFSEAMLEIYRYTQDRVWRDRGETLLARMNELFWDDEQGGYYMGLSSDEGPLITRPRSPMDGALPSGNAVAVSVLARYWHMTGDMATAQRISEVANGFSGLLAKSPSAFPFMIIGLESYTRNQNDYVQYAAQGKVRVEMRCKGSHVDLYLDIADGWHINGHTTDTTLTATEVTGTGIIDCYYPQGVERELEFTGSDNEIVKGTFYDGNVAISLELATAGSISLTLQACDHSRCLVPETLVFHR